MSAKYFGIKFLPETRYPIIDEMNPVVHQNSSVTYNNSRHCGNVIGSYNTESNHYNISISDEKRQVLEWLSSPVSRERHQAVRDARVDGVGDWLLRTETFSAWHTLEGQAAKPVLLCYGDPGVGKTHFSSLVIDTLCKEIVGDNMAVTYVYCDFGARNVQSTRTVLGSVLKQVVGALVEIPDEVQMEFDRAKTQVDGCGLRLPEILEMLIKSLSNLKLSFICIDALDEFPLNHRPELWESLQQLVRDCPNTRLFLTGRPHIQDQVRKYFPKTARMLRISPRPHDIWLYLDMRLKRDPESDAMDKGLRADIHRVVSEKISGIFLLVSLTIDEILAEVTIHQRRKALYRMSNGLGLQDAYNTTLNRIRQPGGSRSKFGMQTLMWISHSERPLKSAELCHALGVELGAEDFGIDNVPSIPTILGCTLGLVTIDENASTLHLVHHTLQEYLAQHPTLFMTPHSMMAEICLTYLSFRSARALPPDLDTALATLPFLKYATCFWGTHAAKKVTEPMKALSLRLLDGYENHVSAAIFRRKKIRKWDWGVRGISGLHCIAFWGIAEIGAAILEMKRWDVNQRDSSGETPLMWAAKYGNDSMVKLFLEQEDIEPDLVIRHGRTVLSFAVEWGKEEIVKLLLERGDVNLNSLDTNGLTPLSFAVEREEEGVVKLLLGRVDVNPNSVNNNGQTPLSVVVQRRHDGILKLLLEREDVNPNSLHINGQTPLSFAARWGREGIVELLLEHRDINPDSLDKNGQTPLSIAALEGHEGVVKLLLARGDVDPNSSDNNGRTPLSFAAEWGEEGVVQLLLECGDVNPDSPGKNGQTPLLTAALKGHEGVVKLLLARGDVDPNSSDNNGRTPLSFAARWGREGTVKLLLERGDVNPNSLDKNSQTPLSFAAREGHEGVVKQLLEREDVKPNSSRNTGRTPLSSAARRGHEGVAKLLLGRIDVSPNSLDKDGRTPLSFAAFEGHESVTKLLLGRGDVNPNLFDKNGQTPLSFAAWRGHEGLVKLLLARGDVHPNSSDNNGRTPLSFAAERGEEGVVQLLLAHEDVNPDPLDKNSQTPLLIATFEGHEGVVKLLLQRGDVNPNSLDKNGQTPLSFAAWRGHEGIVGLLLEREDLNPNSSGSHGQTPLSLAAWGGHEGVVELLLERRDVNPNPLDCDCRSPLSIAAERGNEGVVKLLLERRDVNPDQTDSSDQIPLSFAS